MDKLTQILTVFRVYELVPLRFDVIVLKVLRVASYIVDEKFGHGRIHVTDGPESGIIGLV
jgi:hypothetical protein